MQPLILPLRLEDAPHVAHIFFHAIHEGTGTHYTAAQRQAWAGSAVEVERWALRLPQWHGFMAWQGDAPQGFMACQADGYLNMAFVLPAAAGQGVGKALYAATEAWARAQALPRLHTHASLAAQAFFTARGFDTLHAEEVQRQGQTLQRFAMEKWLDGRPAPTPVATKP